MPILAVRSSHDKMSANQPGGQSDWSSQEGGGGASVYSEFSSSMRSSMHSQFSNSVRSSVHSTAEAMTLQSYQVKFQISENNALLSTKYIGITSRYYLKRIRYS